MRYALYQQLNRNWYNYYVVDLQTKHRLPIKSLTTFAYESRDTWIVNKPIIRFADSRQTIDEFLANPVIPFICYFDSIEQLQQTHPELFI